METRQARSALIALTISSKSVLELQHSSEKTLVDIAIEKFRLLFPSVEAVLENELLSKITGNGIGLSDQSMIDRECFEVSSFNTSSLYLI